MDIDPPSTASGSDHAALESTGGEAKTYDEMWYETSKGLQKPVRFLSSFSNYLIFSSFESDRSQIYFATNFMYQNYTLVSIPETNCRGIGTAFWKRPL